ncbi:MAG TPA: DUF1573 domain-containing protein [Thermoguttaceae bacterium]|nr:DUF1573 domain-containing protein [Thermoguttaceae bacterium]
MPKMFRISFVLAIVLACAAASEALAQKWAVDMFSTTSHDFGTLARGARAEFAFTFKNIYNEDARIERVQTTCGCAGIKYPTEIIKTYQTGQIVITVDTRGFLGRKDPVLTVIFDKPFPATVTLSTHCYIRKDVVFQPGEVQFGSIQQGQGARRKTTVSYAGRDDWAITAVESPSPFIQTELTEVQRGLGRVTYDLWAELKPDAPPGYLTGQLLLRTNDPNPQTAQVPLAVEGVVESELTVRPTSLTFLAASGGEPMNRSVVVQASRPFRVTEIRCDDSRFSWELPTEEKKLHVIPIHFTPGGEPGKTSTRLQIHGDLGGGRYVAVTLFAEVTAATVEE